MMTGMVQDQSLEKQIEKHMGGCMAGFFHIFDRQQSLAAKRLITPKRLTAATGFDSTPDGTEKTAGLTPDHNPRLSPLRDIQSPAPEPGTPSEPRSPLTFPIFEFKEDTRSPWKFSKEAPRLSLDSRAATDAKGSLYPREIRGDAVVQQNARDGLRAGEKDRHRSSPSVIARLMGLENLPRVNLEPGKDAELRRSASESRVNKDLYRFIEGNHNHFQHNQLQQQPAVPSNVIRVGNVLGEAKSRNERVERPGKAQQQRGVGLGHRKSFYDSTDFFPEPPKRSASIYEEIERRLRMRGIDEPSKDLETLKQILDALQLKGLLHSKRPLGSHQRNFVYEKGFEDSGSPIVLMKPYRPSNRSGSGNCSEYPSSNFRSRQAAVRREALPVAAGSPRRDNVRGQSTGRASSTVSPTRSDSSAKSPSRRRLLVNAEQKRVSPVQSPKVDPGRSQLGHTVMNRSPRVQKPVAEVYPTEDESSTASDSSTGTPLQTDTEKTKVEEYKEGGRSLLERCDKLLHSIAEMTASTELQPSPVSVLEAASFYKDESSPSPVMKRNIDFIKDQVGDLDDDLWSVASFKQEENSDDADFVYISDVLWASSYLPEDSDVFLLLEKQQYLKGKDTSSASRLQRKLIFDTVAEILERKQQLPQWRAKPSLQQIWSDYRLIRDRDGSEEDLLEVIFGVLRKDLIKGDAVAGWGKCPVEVSESVLDIERLIFKDLIGETIRDLATCAPECANKFLMPRRRLVF